MVISILCLWYRGFASSAGCLHIRVNGVGLSIEMEGISKDI